MPWSDLCELKCHLYVQANDGVRCVHGLRLDVPQADYRRVSKGREAKMCDFSVIAGVGQAARLVVVELKSGVAYPDAIDQLEEGLRVLHERFERDGQVALPLAYLVVGREIDKTRFALRDKLTSLRFGSSRVKLKIEECGHTFQL